MVLNKTSLLKSYALSYTLRLWKCHLSTTFTWVDRGKVLLKFGAQSSAFPSIKCGCHRSSVAIASSRSKSLTSEQGGQSHDDLVAKTFKLDEMLRQMERKSNEMFVDPVSGDQWLPIYRFKRIVLVSALSRTKIGMTAFAAVLLPISAIGMLQGWADVGVFVGSSLLALMATGLLVVMTRTIFQRVVGVISLSEPDRSSLRVGYLDFWGTRRNMILPTVAIQPFSETSMNTLRTVPFAESLECYDENKLQLFVPKFDCDILEPEMFSAIFGKTFKPVQLGTLIKRTKRRNEPSDV